MHDFDMRHSDTLLVAFIEAIGRHGLASFLEYGIIKGFLDRDDATGYVDFFVEMLAEVEMYEGCQLIIEQRKLINV